MRELHIKFTLEPAASEPMRYFKRYARKNTDPIGKDIYGKNFIGSQEAKVLRATFEKARKEYSPFIDRVKDGRTPSPVFKGDKDERDAGVSVDGIEYRGRVQFYPIIPRKAVRK